MALSPWTFRVVEGRHGEWRRTSRRYHKSRAYPPTERVLRSSSGGVCAPPRLLRNERRSVSPTPRNYERRTRSSSRKVNSCPLGKFDHVLEILRGSDLDGFIVAPFFLSFLAVREKLLDFSFVRSEQGNWEISLEEICRNEDEEWTLEEWIFFCFFVFEILFFGFVKNFIEEMERWRNASRSGLEKIWNTFCIRKWKQKKIREFRRENGEDTFRTFIVEVRE